MTKCNKGKVGKPRFNYGDRVGFYMFTNSHIEPTFYVGTIEIVDAYGTFEQNEEPSYDIFVEDFMGDKCLVKHMRESKLCILDEVK